MVEERRRASSPAFYKRYSDYFGSKFLGEEIGDRDALPDREAFGFAHGRCEEDMQRVLAAMQIGLNYPYNDTVRLPQKSSATALLKARAERKNPKRCLRRGAAARKRARRIISF